MTEIDLTPITRLEYDIDAILNDHAVAEPITRIELILADIVAGNTTTVEPVTRIETYLAIISGADYPVPEPVTRIETFLAIIAGEDYEEPEAVTRLEGLLAEWVEKGSGIWKTVTGTLIHLTDALASPMQKCEATLEPIQDLHGQDAPYPAGGGINKLEPNTFPETTQYGVKYTTNADGSISMIGTVTDTTWNFNSKTIPLSHYGLSAGDTVSVLISGVNTRLVARFFNGSTLLNANIIAENITQSFGTGVGNGIVPNDATNIQLLVYCKASASPTVGETVDKTVYPLISFGSTAPSEWSPYSNICPITGWTGCEVTRTGKNLCDASTLYRGGIDPSSGALTDTGVRVTSDYIPVSPGKTYYGSESSGNVFVAFHCYNKKKENAGSTNVTTNPYTIPAGVYYVRAMFRKEDGTASVLPSEIKKPQIEESTTATDYEPYQGTTASVTFPDTVYGGKYDFVSGSGESKMASVDLGTLTWTYQSSNTRFYSDALENIIKKPAVFSEAVNAISSQYKIVSWGDFGSANDAIAVATSGNMFIRDTRYTDAASFTAALSGVQFVYELADSVDFTLTPQQVSTNAGENNVWGDGNIELTYKARG